MDKQLDIMSWPGFLAQRNQIDLQLENLETLRLELDDLDPVFNPFPVALELAVQSIPGCAVLLGADVPQSRLLSFDELITQELQKLWPETPPSRGELVSDALSTVNAGQCCGSEQWCIKDVRAVSWLRAQAGGAEQLHDSIRWNLALACIAYRQYELSAVFSFGGPFEQKFTPGMSFGPNLQGLIRYLACAVRDQAGFTEVEPAFKNFLTFFPVRFHSKHLNWSHLMWIARICFHQLDNEPVTQVAARLYDCVREAL